MKKRKILSTIYKSAKELFQIAPGLILLKIILSIASSVFSVINVKFIAEIVDTAGSIATDTGKAESLMALVIICVSCFAGIGICTVTTYFIDNIWIIKPLEQFHHKISLYMTEISLEATNHPDIQDKFWRAKDAIYHNRIVNLFMTVCKIVPISINLIGTMLILARYSLILVVIAFVSVFPTGAITYFFSSKEYKLSVKHTKDVRFRDYLWSTLTRKESIREARLYGFIDYLQNKFFSTHKKVYLEQKRMYIKRDAGTVIANLCRQCMYFAAMAIILSLVKREVISVGAFSACIIAFSMMQDKATMFFAYFSEIGNASKYADDYYSLFEFEKERRNDKKFDEHINSIKLENVSYRYGNDLPLVLRNIDLEIKKGELVVIVGENGSGKTTLSKIIMGFFNPMEGNVKVNDENLVNRDLKSYYTKFSILIQDFLRYAISLKDNIKISNWTIEDEQKISSLIHENELKQVLDKLGGMNTLLGIEFGDEELSGGEWQRVALARANYKDSEVLILDEPTSAIDPLQEFKILKQFTKMAKGKTCIIISHRVGICRKADKVIVMENGAVAAIGTHEQLLEQGGKYAELWNSQAQWYQ